MYVPSSYTRTGIVLTEYQLDFHGDLITAGHMSCVCVCVCVSETGSQSWRDGYYSRPLPQILIKRLLSFRSVYTVKCVGIGKLALCVFSNCTGSPSATNRFRSKMKLDVKCIYVSCSSHSVGRASA